MDVLERYESVSVGERVRGRERESERVRARKNSREAKSIKSFKSKTAKMFFPKLSAINQICFKVLADKIPSRLSTD